MPLNTVFGPVSIDNSGFVNGLPTNITALSDASFALTVVDSVTSNAVNSVVYTAQGVLVGGGAAMPPADPQSESYPDIAGLANGGYALAWEEWFTVNGLYQPLVYTAVYDAQGNQISTPIEASSGLSYSELPEVTALNGDGYALTWHAANSNPDRTGDLWTRFFDSAGQPVTAAINLTGPLGGYDQLALAGAPIGVLANGNVVYSWRSGPLGQGEVYTAIYSADGTNVVGPTKLTNTPNVVESDVQLAVLSGGHYALSWQGDSTSTFQSQIYTAVYDSAGNQILAPVVVSGGIGPEIVALSNGEYAIAWVNGDIYTAVFNAQGALVSGIVNLTNTGGQLVGDVEIAALQSGYYALAWAGGVNALPDVFTAVVDAQGNVRVAAQNLSNSPGMEDLLPAITSQGDGTYAITWLNTHTVFLDDQSLAIFQFAPDSDNISIIGSADINLDLSAIINVGGDVTISDNQNLVTLDLHNLVSVGGNFVIGNNGALLTITLPSLTTVSGDLDISGNTSAGVINVGGLTSVSGGLDISGNTSAGAIDVGGLTSVGGNLDLSGNTSATVIDVGGLTSVGGNLDISGNTSVITIDLGALIQAGAIVIANNGVVTLNLSALVQAGGDVSISNNHSLLTVDMPELTSIGGDLDISGNTSAGVINVGGLTSVGGDLDIGGNDSATVINVASLTTVGGDLTIDLAPDATVDASALGAGGGTVHVIGDDGRENTVILGSLAQMQGTLTITTADSVTLTSAAGLGTITLTGTDAGNTLIGSATAKNIINSGGGNDTATGGNNDDLFTSGAGDDTLDGKGGTDTAVYSGSLSDYSVVRHANGSLTVTDTRAGSPDGTDTLTNFELFRFADGTRTPADILPSSDLSITMDDGVTSVVPGTPDTYTIVVTNNGPDTVDSVTLTDVPPAALLNPTFGIPSAGSYDPGSGLWSGLSLASGQSVSMTLSGVIDPNATSTISNTVTVFAPAGVTETNTGNNVATDTTTLFSGVNPPPPPGTSANMILRHAGSGQYEIYNLGSNTILAAYWLGRVGTDWQFNGLGGVSGGNTTMLLRNSGTGGFELYGINNNIVTAAFLGTVGLDWRFAGFGNFSSLGQSDMILRNGNTGALQVYDIANSQITNTAALGTVGLDWQVGGFGNFSSRDTSDMIMRNTATGGLQVYDIDHNQITGSAFLGTVGLDWQISGVGNFSSMPGESDVIMRNATTGGLEVYNIANNQITGSAFLGTVGLEWQFAGVAPIHGSGASDLVLRNVNTGAFEVYNIANNQIIGAASLGPAGLDWQLGAFAADPPTGSMGSSGSTSQLVQAMAGFGGGGAAESLHSVVLGADTLQQTLLTTPQHA